ncbi:MAG: GNAT family N-acetyltransferase [Anaerolineae bacterium]|nr:GNAT family N-acetyltransferase [Anaerolineae bacterium]
MGQVTLRQATMADYDFLYNLKKAALRAYVEPIWGWDEVRQQDLFKKKFDPAQRQIVVHDGADIGVLSVIQEENEIFLAGIEILPAYQGQGIGTGLIQRTLKNAFANGIPVRLQVLKNNPAIGLYERLGFAVVDELETHFLMRTEPEPLK